jgi:hypothetical protein
MPRVNSSVTGLRPSIAFSRDDRSMNAVFGMSHAITGVSGPAISFLATEPQSRPTSLMAT